MRIPRSRGAVSGLLLIVLGAWSALVPFIGPSFDLAIGTDQTWDWSWGRFWLFVAPGVVAIAGGLMLLSSAHRARAGLGAWLGLAAGAWLVAGPVVSRLWTDGDSAAGAPLGDTERQVFEVLTMQLVPGLLILALAAMAMGRLSVRSAREAEMAREAEATREAETTRAREVGPREERLREPREERLREERFRREPEPEPEPERAPEPEWEREPATAATAPSEQPTTASASTSTAPTSTTPAASPPPERRRGGGLLGRLKR
jgi:hypothetical protein